MNKNRKIHVVIGANFGDEGKGRVVKHLVETRKVDLVIKHNGGSQAGHTVVGPNGARFVHSQVGSGAMFGVKTYIADTFQFNPLLLEAELDDLETVTGETAPLVLVDVNAHVTFTMDMMINQLRETVRGESRHGSCGHGIFEAFDRARDGLVMTVGGMQALRADELVRWHDHAVRRYLRRRGDVIGDTKMFTVESYDGFMRAGEALYRLVNGKRIKIVGSVPDSARNLVFECGQGLGLDMNNREYFPHLTPSNTGSLNAIKTMIAGDVEEVNLHYVTRPYVTRHGRGRLNHEMSAEEFSMLFPNFTDKTNVPNEWQGALRFARIDTREMRMRILNDAWGTFHACDPRDGGFSLKRSFHVTCASHGPDLVHDSGRVSLGDTDALHSYFNEITSDKTAETTVHCEE
jgi:adenylosuccinate synthase